MTTRTIWILTLFVSTLASNITIDQIEPGNTFTPVSLALNATYQVVLIYKNIETLNPFRITARSTEATVLQPILVVIHQERQVTSWQVPLIVESTKSDTITIFQNTSRTLCHDYLEFIVNPDPSNNISKISQTFMIGLSTFSLKSVTVTVEVEEQTDFYVTLDTAYSLAVSPSQPRYVFYKFDENTTDTIVINVESEDDICLTLSVQDTKCPVLDMNKDITYEGTYQTINLKGAMTIKKTDYKFGFFIVFVAKPDNYACSQENSYIPRLTKIVNISPVNRTSIVQFSIRNGITKNNYILATLITLLILSIAGIVLTILALVFNRLGTISKNKYDDIIITDYFEPLSEDQVQKLLKCKELTVDLFSRHPKRIKKRSYNYLSHILSIAIFYSIPVVQLVVTYQRIVNITGNEDMCYYNFLCAHPALGLSDFNHIYSNIGYVFFGIIFIIGVIDRHTIIKIRKEKGIPVHYGLFHAMGVALIIEGLLSACYHICPSQSNYQFDTSFMYIMAVLIMIKLYQNRHPDINATAYSTFTILGATIFMAMVGILDGSMTIWIIFMICYSSLCIALSFKIYFLNFVIDGINQLRSEFNKNGFCHDAFKPIRKGRFIFLLIANLVNYGMLVTGIWMYISNGTDFGTFLLGLMLGNAVMHVVFYMTMKLMHGEKICFEAIFYGLLGMGTWAASGVFFLDAATLWTVTPAESRQWNQGCILMNFFDKHDVWHLLSAPALYFTFMFLMCLDDDIVDKNQSEIPVF